MRRRDQASRGTGHVRGKRVVRRWGGLAVGVAMVVLLGAAPSSSAGLLDEPVRSVVSSLPSASSVTGSVPELSPAPAPSSGVGVPAPPKVDLPPPSVSAAPKPSAQAPASDPPVGATSAASRAVDEVAAGVGTSADAIVSQPGPADQGEGAAGSAGSSGGSGKAGAGSDVPSVQPAEAAPRRQWLTRVWPAVSLGPIERLLPALQSSLSEMVSLAIPSIPLILSRLAPDGAAAPPSLPRSAVSDPSPAAPRELPLPVGGEISVLILLLASAILTALLVFAVRQELGPMHRWPE
jgi:hypothetical protein